MNPFAYSRAENLGDALRMAAAHPGARYIAGGTNLVDLMKYRVERPDHLIDITRLPLRDIKPTSAGLLIGALVSNADLACHPQVAKDYPLLSSAILAGASPQLRNAATTGGNLLQRTRCYYFYDAGVPCNKRDPGSGCPAREGVNRIHAILGASEHCIATHPSDMCVALAALEAVVKVSGPQDERSIAVSDFHRLPGERPEVDNTLVNGELVTGVELPRSRFPTHYSYLKLRDRASYAFALVSVAAALEMQDGAIKTARIALGGVAHKPWRVPAAEATLEGHPANRELFTEAAKQILAGAQGQGHNDFKIELAQRAIVRALSQAAAAQPQSQSVKRIN